ncbi:hypothetical protein ABPG77_009013 [Micractinium sp. CCAP 211/92]
MDQEERQLGSPQAQQPPLLVAQQAADDASPPQSAGRKGRDKYEYDRRYLLFASNYDFARRQHLSNLVLLLRQYAATRDWQRLAGVVATLMASDRPENLSEAWIFRHPESRARLAEALGAGWLLLQQGHPGELSYEQTSRFLKQWAALQILPAGREAVFLELARYSCAQGHATDAWDFLSSQKFSTAASEAQRLAVMASIRMDSWSEAMRAAAELQFDIPQPPSSSPNKRRRGRLGRQGGGWQPWQHDAQLLVKGGRLVKELHQEALDCYSKALSQEPSASHLARQLAQLQLAGGDTQGALETARCLRRRAAADADAAGLLALLLVAQPAEPQQPSSQQAGGEEEASMVPPRPAEAAAAAADCCCQLLTADPFCHTAAAALLALNEQHPLPPALLVSGCCAYLEAQPPAWLPPLLELRVWQHLATALTQAAAAVSTRARELHNLQRQRQPLLPRTLREMRRLREQPQDGSTPTQQRWQQLQQLGEAAHLERQQLERALAVYRQCCTVLEGRLWWRDAHLLPQPAATVAAALQEGAANPCAVLAHAAVNAFLHPLWQQRMVAEWRASGGTGSLPHVVQNLMSRHTAAALEQCGHRTEAAALRTAMKLGRRAAAASASGNSAFGGQGTVAALASLARHRSDFWRAARKPWKRTQQMSQQHGREQEQEQQHPSTQQARALRRIEQPGVRSILKASQPPGVEPTWGEASQQLPGVLLGGSDPTSTRVPRRVQFQLPEQAASGSLAGAAIDEDAGDNGGSSQAQHSHINQQEAGGSAAVGDMQHSKAKSRGKRRLLPQLPQALAQEEEEGGDGTNNPAWKQRLQQRRQRLSS